MAPNRRKRGTHAGASHRKKTATMAGTSPSKNRIVPVLSDQKPASKSSRNTSRSLRQQLLKGEFDKDVLRLPCLDELRLYAAPIRGDGNCLFSSLSDQLYGYPDHHEEIRKRLVDHVREKSDYFMQFVSDVGGERRAPRRAAAAAAQAKQSNTVGREATGEGQRAKFEKLVSQMGMNGFWGGSVELQAFCQAYGKDVMVYTEHGIQTFTGDSAPGDQEREAIHLAYHAFEHYSSVRSLDGPHTGLPRLPRRPGNDLNGRGGENGGWNSPSNLSAQTTSQPLNLAAPWKISSISEALPGYDEETIRAMLTKCHGNINNAFTRLLDPDLEGFSQDDSLHTPPPSSSTSANSQARITPPTSATFRPSSRVFLGSSSRSSSRHSTASKRSADQSDDDEGPIRSANRRRRGRDRKRRILQDVTVGIAVRDEDENDVISIKLRVDPDADAERAEGAPRQGAADDTSSTDDSSRSGTEQSDDRRRSTVSDSATGQSSQTVSEGTDSGGED